METFQNMPLAKRVFFEYVVSKDEVTQSDFDVLRKVSSRAFQYGKANTNARYREHVLGNNETLCCDYCGKKNLIHNPLKTKGTMEEYVTNHLDFFYTSKKVINPATVDHINPISLGAEVTSFDNLTISCEGCNSDKGSMTFKEWVEYMTMNKSLFTHYFENFHQMDKYQNALNFVPDDEHLNTFEGEVKINREDLSPYIRYKLGYLFDAKNQRILSSNKLTRPYNGSINKPNIKKNLWITPDGENYNINEVKLFKVKKSLEVIKNDLLCEVFFEVHNINVSEQYRRKWIKKMEDLIAKKTTNGRSEN